MRDDLAAAWPARAVGNALWALILGAAFAGAQASDRHEAQDPEESSEEAAAEASESEAAISGDGQSQGGQGTSNGASALGKFLPMRGSKLYSGGGSGADVKAGDADANSGGSAANCLVVDQAKSYPAWLPGCSTMPGRSGSGVDMQAPILASEPGQVVSYKFHSDRLLNSARDNHGVMDFYEAPPGALISINNTPCSFDANPCTRIGDRFNGISYVGPNMKITAAQRSQFCQLPKPEAGSNAYYVNVQMPKMKCARQGSCGGQAGCPDGQLCYFLLYSGGSIPASSSTPGTSSGGNSGDNGHSGNAITCKGSNPPCYWQAKYSATNQTIACAIPGFSPTHSACGCDPAATSQTRPGPLNAAPCP